MARNPVKDRVAIVGVGSTGFTRTNERSSLALALDAATQAIRDAGLRASDVDGVVAVEEPGAPSPQMLASSLGLERVTHWTRPTPVAMFAIADAVNAIFSGSADTVLVVSSMLRLPWASRSAANDPFRRRAAAQRVQVPEDIGLAVA